MVLANSHCCATTVTADSQLIEECLMHLVTNAKEAMPNGGTLTVGARPIAKVLMKDHERAVQINIRDTGPGIPQEIRTTLFEPFVTTKAEGQGTGLGLSVTLGIARAVVGA